MLGGYDNNKHLLHDAFLRIKLKLDTTNGIATMEAIVNIEEL